MIIKYLVLHKGVE